MKPTIKFLFRLAALPFMLGAVSLSYVFLTLKGCYMFLFYGGEILIYNKRDKAMMGDVFQFAKQKMNEQKAVDKTYQPLFNYFADVHGLTLLESEMQDVIAHAKSL